MMPIATTMTPTTTTTSLITDDRAQNEDDGPNWALIGGIIGGVLCLLITIAIIVAVCVARRRSGEKSPERPPGMFDAEDDARPRSSEYASTSSLNIYDSFKAHTLDAQPKSQQMPTKQQMPTNYGQMPESVIVYESTLPQPD